MNRGATVVLMRDVPEKGLRAGDVGRITDHDGAGAIEVKFVAADGVLLYATLLCAPEFVRKPYDDELMSVRSTLVGGRNG
jgi:hypothetical protein